MEDAGEAQEQIDTDLRNREDEVKLLKQRGDALSMACTDFTAEPTSRKKHKQLLKATKAATTAIYYLSFHYLAFGPPSL